MDDESGESMEPIEEVPLIDVNSLLPDSVATAI